MSDEREQLAHATAEVAGVEQDRDALGAGLLRDRGLQGRLVAVDAQEAAPWSRRAGRSRGCGGVVSPGVKRILRRRLNSSISTMEIGESLLRIDQAERGVDPHLGEAAEDEAAEVVVAEAAEEAGLGPQHGQRGQRVAGRRRRLAC